MSPENRDPKIPSNINEVEIAVAGALEREFNERVFSGEARRLVSEGHSVARAIPLSILSWLEQTAESLRQNRTLGQWIVEETGKGGDYRKAYAISLIFGFHTTLGFAEAVARQRGSADEVVMEAFESLDAHGEQLRREKGEIYQEMKPFFREELPRRAETYINLSQHIKKGRELLTQDSSGLQTVAVVLEYFLEETKKRNRKFNSLSIQDFAIPIRPRTLRLLRQDPFLYGSILAMNIYGFTYGNGFASQEEREAGERAKRERYGPR